MAPKTAAQQEAANKYLKDKVDEFKVRVKKGKKAGIIAHAQSKGESLNSFVNRAIDETIERDKEDGE